jgi:hypothetical protein|tara:strand:+ start:239 stop:721 length:483 start_codon:yes stop_codon:yes gene_type:complete
MNIFFLDKSPELAAKYLCDKHVPKMLLESSQMLSTAIQRHLGGTIGELYKPAYPKHPMTIWVGDNKNNFKWALENASFINKQYEVRFNKKHKSNRVIEFIKYWDFSDSIPQGDMTNPPQCMPDNYKGKSHVIAYRKYYKGDKSYFAKWEKGVAMPTWWLK